MNRAIERLARAGFEDTVYDEAIVAEEMGNIGPVFALGSAPVVIWGARSPLCHANRTGSPLTGPLRPILPTITYLTM